MSYIHFKSVYNINYDKVTFDSSSLTLQELKNLIAEKSKFSKKLDFDLEISNAETNQVYQEKDTILKNTRVIVKRIIKNSTTPLRQQSPKPSPSLVTSQSTINLSNLASDRILAKSKSISPSTSLTNLKEKSSISSNTAAFDYLSPLSIPSKPVIYVEAPDRQAASSDVRTDEKARLESILASSISNSPTSENQTRLAGFSKSWQKQVSPINRPIPPGYVCVICRKPGHLKQFCPEAANLPKPEERPKYPSGIPRTNLRPAQPGEKFAMLGPEGYVVTEIDKEAAKVVKKDRLMFEDEEIKSQKLESETKIEDLPEELKCSLGEHLLKDAVLVPCCGHFICCDECIRQKIINEETIICPNKECDQEIGPMVSITPDHETRKKVQDYLEKSKKKKIFSQTQETKSDAFFDMIMSEVNGNEENLGKSEPVSPVQDSNISSSELLSQQLISASSDSQLLSPAPLPTPPITPTVDLARTQAQAYSNYQYRARFLGQKAYPGQVYPTSQGFYPYMPRSNFYGQSRPRFARPSINMYPQMPFYSSMEHMMGNYQNVMSESQFYEYQENLKKEKEYESKIDKREDRHRRSRSRERYKRSRSRSRSRHRDKYKPRQRSRSRSRGRHRSRSRSRRKYKRSKSRPSEKKYKKKSRTRSSSKKRKRSKSNDRKKNKSRSRSTSLSSESKKLHKSKKKEK